MARNQRLIRSIRTKTGFSLDASLYSDVTKRKAVNMYNRNDFTVLLVEDDLNDIFLVKRAFKKVNLNNPLQIVTDGVEAVQYLIGEGKYADRKTYPLPDLI